MSTDNTNSPLPGFGEKTGKYGDVSPYVERVLDELTEQQRAAMEKAVADGFRIKITLDREEGKK